MSISTNYTQRDHRFYPCPICHYDHTSITTLFKALGSDALMGWAGKVGTKKLKIFADHVKTIRKDVYDQASKEAEQDWEKEEGNKDFWKSSYEISKEARDVGTVAHAAIEADLLGKPTDSLQGLAANSYRAYLDWKKTVVLETIETERTFYNCEMGYACTSDWRGKLNGKLTLGDWKSGSIYSTGVIQCWANAIADEMQNGNILYEQILVGSFQKDGSYDSLIVPRKGLKDGFGGYEQARELIKAVVPWYKYQQRWAVEFPYVKKKPIKKEDQK
jgi:hypothetical protein